MNLEKLSSYLKLSPTTVSRAINGFPEVSEKTRKRVKQAAHEFGYSPSNSAKSLATGRSYTIGHVVPQSHQELLNPIFGDFIAGAGSVYSERGYRMLLNMAPDGREHETYREFVRQRSVDGVIVHGPRMEEPRVGLLKEIGLPFVVHGRVGGSEHDYSYLDVNNRRAFRRAVEYLINLGHTRIALLNGLKTANFAYRREMGYRDALQNAGLEIDCALILAREMSMDFGKQAFFELSMLPDAPTAYICSSSVIAMGLHHEAMCAGLKIGQDFSVITHDDDINFFRLGSAGQPLFTSMRSSVKKAGARCAAHIIDIIESPDQFPRQELWEAELVIGQSTGPAPK